MASTSSQDSPASNAAKPKMGTGRKIAYGLGAVLVIILIIFAWNFSAIKAFSDVGTGYAARVVCSCRYVGGRELGDCEKDLEPGMELVSLSDNADAKRITASVTLLAEDQAEFREGFGCVLLSDAEREALKE